MPVFKSSGDFFEPLVFINIPPGKKSMDDSQKCQPTSIT